MTKKEIDSMREDKIHSIKISAVEEYLTRIDTNMRSIQIILQELNEEIEGGYISTSGFY